MTQARMLPGTTKQEADAADNFWKQKDQDIAWPDRRLPLPTNHLELRIMAKHDGSKNDELNKLNGGEVIALPHRKPLLVRDPDMQVALKNLDIEITRSA